VEKRTPADSRLTDHGQTLTLGQIQIQPAQNMDLGAAFDKRFM
jgi:hypothetical protein